MWKRWALGRIVPMAVVSTISQHGTDDCIGVLVGGQLVYSWAGDWCSDVDEWWGPWRRTEEEVLKALRRTSSQFA